MTLAEVLSNLESFNRKWTIYATKDPTWGPDSRAVVLPNPGHTMQPVRLDGDEMEHLLEVFIAKEVLDVWKDWHEGRTPTPEEMCDAVIYYSVNDAYLE